MKDRVLSFALSTSSVYPRIVSNYFKVGLLPAHMSRACLCSDLLLRIFHYMLCITCEKRNPLRGSPRLSALAGVANLLGVGATSRCGRQCVDELGSAREGDTSNDDDGQRVALPLFLQLLHAVLLVFGVIGLIIWRVNRAKWPKSPHWCLRAVLTSLSPNMAQSYVYYLPAALEAILEGSFLDCPPKIAPRGFSGFEKTTFLVENKETVPNRLGSDTVSVFYYF